jgi:hypothetical protein
LGEAQGILSNQRPHNSDQLGKLGEDEFKVACSRAKIVCNEVRRDRFGWDAMIEFDYEPPSANMSLDHRPAPISCYVQIKTIWEDSKTVKLKLSAAEHIAKKHLPSFIIVQRVATNLQVAERIVIHLLDDPLAKILKKLRQASAAGVEKINSEWVYFNVDRDGTRIPATGDALRDAIVSAIGGLDAQSKYLQKKENQRKTLGYGPHGYAGSFEFSGVNIEDFVDGFLGLKDLSVNSMAASEIRFGISRALPGIDGPATLKITPSEPTPCKVGCHVPGGEAPVVIHGEFRAPMIPGLPKENFKVLARTELFDLTLTLTDMNWKPREGVFKNHSASPTIWLDFYRFSRLVTTPGAILRVEPLGQRTLELPCVDVKHTMDQVEVTKIEKICANAQRIVELVGQADLTLTADEVVASHNDVAICLALIDNETDGPFFTVTSELEGVDPEEIDPRFGFCAHFPLGDICIAYSVLCDATYVQDDSHFTLKLQAQRFGEIRLVNDDVELERFHQRTVKNYELKAWARYPSLRLREAHELAAVSVAVSEKNDHAQVKQSTKRSQKSFGKN